MPSVGDERYESKSSLVDRLKKEIEASLNVSISASIAELQAQSYTGRGNLGDRIFVADDHIDVNVESRILSRNSTYNVNGKPITTSFTLSNKGLKEAYKAQMNNAVK